jgi:hypothetical protein
MRKGVKFGTVKRAMKRGIENYLTCKVSNLGKFRNKKTGRILKSAKNGGYVHVALSKNGDGKTRTIHRLVSTEFIDNEENKPTVNHLDKDKTNNCVENLEWATVKENNAHKSATLVQTTNQQIKLWRLDKKTSVRLQLYNSIQEAAKWCVENGYTPDAKIACGNISSVLRGVYKSSCGFKWERFEPDVVEDEVWKNVKINGVEVENYQVSCLGRFRNSKGIIMENYKPHHSGFIYVRVNKQKYALHNLVASTFIENTLNKPFVYHTDGNRINNNVNNLEWLTSSEIGKKNHDTNRIKIYTRKIGQYNLDGELIKEHNSIAEAMNETSITSIKKVLYEEQKTAGGFIWKYLDEEKEDNEK